MNGKTLQKLKSKKHAYQRNVHTRDGEDYLKYARARNQAKSAGRKAIKEYEQQIAKDAKKNPKAFYVFARSKTKIKDGIADLIDEDGNIASEDKAKAQMLNRFFCSVFTQENQTKVSRMKSEHLCEPL